MGESSGFGGLGTSAAAAAAAAQGLEPSSPLSVAEAAAIAGVPPETLETQIEDGTLLFETGQAGNRIVRWMDLAEAYPGLRPPGPAEPLPGPGPAVAETAVVEAVAGDDNIASAVRASGTDRNALIELCQDLETRLDLAERERQASTASLLMAQRRVLDLERRDGRRPMAWIAGATLGVFGIALAILAFRLPSTVRAAARLDLESVQTGFEERTSRMQAALDASMASLAGSMVDAMETARMEERELLKSEREGQTAQIAALEARLAEARALQASEAAERYARDGEERRQESEALEIRLRAAEALGQSAREALAQERDMSEAQREVFRQQMSETLERHAQALKDSLARLESAATPPVLPAADVLEEKNKAPAPWWKRALSDLRD